MRPPGSPAAPDLPHVNSWAQVRTCRAALV